MYKKRGLFVTFEGIEGSGKSFQSLKLYKNLKKKKISATLTREPGGTKAAELIRGLILNDYFRTNSKEQFHKYTDTLLYLAARNEHVKNKIIPEINKKKVVICDRFIDSTIAYQHFGMKIDKKIINSLNQFLLDKVKPNFTFLNIVSKKNLIKRLRKRTNKNRYDRFKLKFYNNVQRGFLKISKNKKNYMIVNSNLSIESNKKIILKKILQLI